MRKEKLSYSFASKLLSKLPEEIIWELENPTPPTDAMEDGQRAEFALAHGLEKFKFLDYKERRAPFKAEKAQIIAENPFYEQNPYLICLEAKKEEIALFLSQISLRVKSIIAQAEKQVYFSTEDFGVPVHGYLDFETEDAVYEMKLTDPNPDKFRRQVMNFGWHIQAFLYQRYAESKGKEFKWLAISPKPPHAQRIFTLCDTSFLDVGGADFMKAVELFKEFNEAEGFEIEIPLEAPRWV